MSKMMTAAESNAIDFATRIHGNGRVRATTVGGKSVGTVGRHNQHFSRTDGDIYQPSPRTDRKPLGGSVVGIGYDVKRVRTINVERVIEYHWGLMIGFGRNAWQSTPCPIKYNNRSQAESVASSLFEEEKLPRVVGKCLRRQIPRVLWQAFATTAAK